ncbi:hypothetical protein GFK03_15380, partial [Salmonella enterica subsp. enterica serovar Enteritidis]|nr:hypothetical protein [Salmonella enterica subsp. enterica serovar Enteritidis]
RKNKYDFNTKLSYLALWPLIIACNYFYRSCRQIYIAYQNLAYPFLSSIYKEMFLNINRVDQQLKISVL